MDSDSAGGVWGILMIEQKRECIRMRRKQDEFACVNKTRKRGNMLVFTIAVLAVCISGALYARKLQMDEKYITRWTDTCETDEVIQQV